MPLGVLAAFLVLACALPVPLSGQAGARLSPDDPVHRDLDRLAAWGLVDTVLVGQRPWSRGVAARMTAQAMRARGRLEAGSPLAPTADRTLARLVERLAPELERIGAIPADATGRTARPVEVGARVDATWTDSPSRAVPPNVVATSEARINPLLAYDLGRDVVQGATLGAEVELAAGLGGRLAVSLRPRAQLARREGGGTETEVTLQRGSARLLLGNAAVTVGVDHLVWGQSARGGLLLSTNPGALAHVSVATEHPVSVPWVGPARFQLFLADLGTEAQRFANSQIFGMRASALPHPRLEVGAQFLVQSGGEGAPEASLGDRILDHLFFPDLFMSRELLASNKVAGMDARLRVPEAAGLEAWVELAIDDIDIDRFRSMLWEDGSWTVGARLARLDPAGTLALRVEGQHTGIRMYEHADFSSGLTLERRLLGSELGPNANGVTIGLEWEASARQWIVVEGEVERRSADPYMLVIGTPYYFARLGILPKERRWRVRGAWELLPGEGDPWRLRVEAGWERVERYAFAPDDTRNHLLLRTVMTARLPW